MGQFTDQPADRVARQSGIRIKGDNELYIVRHERWLSVDSNKIGIFCAPQEAVELMQLAPLALPSDPPTFAIVPHATSVQQQEPVSAGRL